MNTITDKMVASAPGFTDLMHDIRRRLDATPLVAHNLKFDTDFLIDEFARHTVTSHPRYGHCTMRQADGAPTPPLPREERTFYSKRQRQHVTYTVRTEQRWQELAAAMEPHGIRPNGRLHDAVTDAVGCGEVFVARGRAAIIHAKNAVMKSEQDRISAADVLHRAQELRRRWRV